MTNTTELDKIVAVSNTGPLVSAFQCGRIDLLQRYFSLVYITTSEVQELDIHGWLDEITQLIREGFVVVADLTDSEKQQAESVAKRIARSHKSPRSDWRDDLAEAEAMILMQNRTDDINAAIILLDEKAARKIAGEMGLKITGFPGILGRAGLDGILTKEDIRHHLKTCQQQGTYYSDRLIETLAETYGR